ncbi:YaiI/YqxD family protein [Thiotrichales bacterium 19S3-7]|nr:YaiI/YqxD family protein [Thiotrichales bacterium 19S3-7]MCF6801638.1 YaiI/YqxD family protein [Thiotrichales bacterium 19S3-11]
MTKKMPQIFKVLVDADACPKPIKEIIYRAAIKRQTLAIFVANQYLNLPDSDYIVSKTVSKGFDVADNYIVDKTQALDLVVTSDIPLADLVIEKGAFVITPYGKLYDKSNIKPALAKRNFMTQMRDAGLAESKTKEFSNKQAYAFATAFDRYLTKILTE